ncbi:MAG: tetratricopeptide repeat protein [Rhodospirillales bacterium]
MLSKTPAAVLGSDGRRARALPARPVWLAPVVLGAFLISGRVGAAADIATELEEAQAALSAGEYDKAFREYRRFAEEKGNPLAQFTLGLFFQLGWGRPVNPVAACQWHEKAAAGGIPAAQHFLADCLVEGIHRPADAATAALWYERAAQNGHTVSLCSLAALYIAGRGIPKEPAKGLALCRQAAEAGFVRAQVLMGRFLVEGDPEVRDPGAALAWFEAAARQGSAEAQYRLGLMLRDGLGGPKDPATARIRFETAASQGHVPAYFPTGALYFEAPPDPETNRQRAQDVAKAYLWLSAAAKRSKDPDELDRTAEMLAKLRRIMPETWLPTLDEKVARHLAEHPAP